MYYRLMIFLAAVVAAASPVSAALTADEVVVVVNSKLPKSIALGRFYCAKRGVPTRNLVELDLPTTESISSIEFDSRLRDPLRKALLDRGLSEKVQCLLTVWGVPFRLEKGPPPPELQKLLTWYHGVAERAHRRVAGNLLLMATVGKHFPATAKPSTPPEAFDELFEARPTPDKQLPEVKVLKQRLGLMAQKKAVEAAGTDDPDRRAIMVRQIVALYIDTYGFNGWDMALAMIGPNAPPIPATLADDRRKANEDLQGLLQIKSPDDLVYKKIEQAFLVCHGAAGTQENMLAQARTIRARNNDSRAAVDSELCMLLCKSYSREGYLANPLRWQHQGEREKFEAAYGGRVLMTSRIDGPTIETVMRMVLSAIEAEKTGLKGKLYVDMGSRLSREFHAQLANLAQGFQYGTDIPVVYDVDQAVFREGTCPDAALYMGWSSPRKYVPAFTWNTGAVGVHVTMFEARGLRDPHSTHWAPSMLKAGVVATMAAADDPGLVSFPSPSGFFSLLVSGKANLAETYWRTQPCVSWRLMLLGDPLYNPFKASPHDMELPAEMLPPEETK